MCKIHHLRFCITYYAVCIKISDSEGMRQTWNAFTSTTSEKNYITLIDIYFRSSYFLCELSKMRSRSDKFGESVCTTFMFLTTYLPRSTCRLFARARWRCPIRSVWSVLSWLDCDSNPVRRFAGTGETRWNPRVLVQSSQMTLGSRSNRVQFWPVSR